jgi:hypothetical protein
LLDKWLGKVTFPPIRYQDTNTQPNLKEKLKVPDAAFRHTHRSKNGLKFHKKMGTQKKYFWKKMFYFEFESDSERAGDGDSIELGIRSTANLEVEKFEDLKVTFWLFEEMKSELRKKMKH